MLNALANFFSPEAGQSRRRWLNEQEQRLGNALAYYLGPAAGPVQSAALLAGYMTPGADMMDASNAGRELFNADTPMDAATAAATAIAAGGMMLLPGNVGALREGFDQSVNALAAYDPTTVNAFRAYHGSPHTFDRFDISRIGTGEGAQAYGHGLYFAESEGVARAYRDALSGDNIEAANYFIGQNVADPGAAFERALNAAQQAGARGDSARAIARQIVDGLPEMDGRPARDYLSVWDVPPQYRDAYNAAAQAAGDIRYQYNPGTMYEVQINADPADFLDWDAPLPEAQAYDVYNSVSKWSGSGMDELADMFYNMPPGDMTGQDAYRWIGATADRGAVPDGVFSMPSAEGSRFAAQTLREASIPGIRYLDAGSRAAGDGSRNFVVFDDSIINILRRYGIGAAAIGGGWALSPEDAQAATDMGVLDPQQRDRQQITDWLNTL